MNESNPINRNARHNARRGVLQAMYQWQLTGNDVNTIEAEFIAHHLAKKVDIEYFKALLHGIINEQATIDQQMEPFLKRSFEEIDPIELAVLRMAIFELMQRPEIPYRVVINEALELTKKFGSVEGYKFINGILDRVAKTVRQQEVTDTKK